MNPIPLQSRTATALLFAAVFGAAALVGLALYRFEVRVARHELQRKVLAVGRLKARDVEHWIEERRQDARSIATGSVGALDLDPLLEGRRIDPETREGIRAWLRRLASIKGYAEIAIVAPGGRVVLAAGDPSPALDAVRFDLADLAIRDGREKLSPLQRSASGEVQLDLFAPLTTAGVHGGQAAAALVFRIDPRQYFYPLIQSWPTDSPTAETLLVERDGASALFLNELRHRRGTALALRLPIDSADLLAAKALRGERGLLEGTDYRDVPVLGWVEAIEGTPWILIAKIDQEEAYGPLRDYAWTYAVYLLLAAGGAAALVWVRLKAIREASLQREHARTRQYVKALETAEAEREALIEKLQTALDDVKTLRGIVPICASCKRVRDDAGYWKQVEAYVSEHTEAQFSHGVCPDCLERLYPEFASGMKP